MKAGSATAQKAHMSTAEHNRSSVSAALPSATEAGRAILMEN